MPIGHGAEEGADAWRSVPQHLAGVGVEEQRALAAEGYLDWRIGAGAPGDRGWPPRRGAPRTADERGDVQACRIGSGRRAVQAASVGPAGELLLVSEQHPSYRHDEHDGADRDAGTEVEPEDERAKGFHRESIAERRCAKAKCSSTRMSDR